MALILTGLITGWESCLSWFFSADKIC